MINVDKVTLARASILAGQDLTRLTEKLTVWEITFPQG